MTLSQTFTELSWLQQYGEPLEALPTAAEQAALAKLNLRCEIDPRFTKAARHHAETLASSAETISSGRMEHLRFTLHQLGAHDYSIVAMVENADETGLAHMVRRIRRLSPNWSHCGLGIADIGTKPLVVLVGTHRTLDIAPFSNRVCPESTIRLTAASRSQGGKITLYLGRPDTTVLKVLPSRTGTHRSPKNSIDFDIPIDTAGRYMVELLHDTGHGPETVMLAPIFAGVEPDRRPTVIPDIKGHADRYPADLLLDYLNSARKRVRVTPLKPDLRLKKVAQAHSKEMAAVGFFGHVSPFNGGLKQRLKQANLHPRQSAENIAESTTPLRIHRNLMASPAHRINMLNPIYTHVGIGVHSINGVLFVTQIYAAWE